jgi:hypothetical protein
VSRRVPLCKKHPRYQAKRRPRNDCRECLIAWMRRDPETRAAVDGFMDALSKVLCCEGFSIPDEERGTEPCAKGGR